MYLSYSGYKAYSACPRSYWFRYIAKPVLVELENRVNSLYGTIVGGVFELFYSEKLWNGSPTEVESRLQARVLSAYERAVTKETKDGVIKWKPDDKKANYKSPEDLLEDVRKTIPRGIRIIRHHRLLGANAAAEVQLDHQVARHTIGGRADFLMRRIGPHHDLILLDGKGSKWRDKYVDVRQLKWYAMLHRLKHKHAPDRLGFVYWRYEPDKSLDWVEVTLDELDKLQATVLEAIQQIDEGRNLLTSSPQSLPEVFPVRPGDACRFCPYVSLCPPGQKFNSLIVPTHDGTGVEDVGF